MPYTAYYTSTRRYTQYYTDLKRKIRVYAKPIAQGVRFKSLSLQCQQKGCDAAGLHTLQEEEQKLQAKVLSACSHAQEAHQGG